MARKFGKESKGKPATYVVMINVHVARSTIVVTLVAVGSWAGYYYGV